MTNVEQGVQEGGSAAESIPLLLVSESHRTSCCFVLS